MPISYETWVKIEEEFEQRGRQLLLDIAEYERLKTLVTDIRLSSQGAPTKPEDSPSA